MGGIGREPCQHVLILVPEFGQQIGSSAYVRCFLAIFRSTSRFAGAVILWVGPIARA